MLEILGSLAGRQQRLHAGQSRRRRGWRAARARYGAATCSSVTINSLAATQQRRDLARRRGSISRGTDQDVIGAVAKFDAQCLDRAASSARLRIRAATGRARAPPAPRSSRDRRQLGRTVAAVDRDVGLGIDRVTPLDQLGKHRPRVAAPATAAGCCAATPAPAARRDRRAATPIRRGAAISARVIGSIKAPPPVASTCGGCASSRAMTRRSPSRNTASPRLRKMSSIVSPAAVSISLIRIEERQTEPRRQTAADLGLAGAHQADQHDRAGSARSVRRCCRLPISPAGSGDPRCSSIPRRSSARSRSERTSIWCGRSSIGCRINRGAACPDRAES